VIATLAAADPAREVLIASTDQDYYQLLRDPGPGRGGVRVLNTAMRPGHRFIGPAQMTARYHVSPRQYPDLRALCGDSSDNIPGVKGIGAKTAATLLSGGLTLDDLPSSGRLTGTKGTAIIAAWEQVLRWRSMIRMHADLPLAARPVGTATVRLPIPGQVIATLGLWRRAGPAAGPLSAGLPPSPAEQR
jgi:DNA polymerase I